MMFNTRYYFIVIVIHCILQLSITSVVRAQKIIGDIPLPSSEYKRLTAEPNSYAQWLRNLALKKTGSPVLDFRGNVFKSGEDTIVAAVVKWDISGRRLEQCMDIVIRLYAEYIWNKKEYKGFQLPLPGGTWLSWDEWRAGNRPYFNGLQVNLKTAARPDSSYSSFIKYLNVVFSESHTQQFYHSYETVNRRNVQIGDFVVKKGTKGHAVMIVDLAKNLEGQLFALIGNGDTPACQFFLLNHTKDNPWIPLYLDTEVIALPLRRKMTWDGLRRFELPKRD